MKFVVGTKLYGKVDEVSGVFRIETQLKSVLAQRAEHERIDAQYKNRVRASGRDK